MSELGVNALGLLISGFGLACWAQILVIRLVHKRAFKLGYHAGESHGYSVGFAKSARVIKIVPDAHCPKDAEFLLPLKETP